MTWGGRKIADLRPVVLAAHGARCWLCHRVIDVTLKHPHPAALTIDHVLPRSKGGSDAIENLRPAHRRCNLRRGARPASRVRPPRRPETGARFFTVHTREAPPATSLSPQTAPKKPGNGEISTKGARNG